MQSEIIAMMVPLDSLGATMLVRRADGQIDFARIDARLAVASRVASRWLRLFYSRISSRSRMNANSMAVSR
jgi:hypothetical protein